MCRDFRNHCRGISQLPVTRQGVRASLFSTLRSDRLCRCSCTEHSSFSATPIHSFVAARFFAHLWSDGRLPCRESPSPESAPPVCKELWNWTKLIADVTLVTSATHGRPENRLIWKLTLAMVSCVGLALLPRFFPKLTQKLDPTREADSSCGNEGFFSLRGSP
jgi:hypothetical protein